MFLFIKAQPICAYIRIVQKIFPDTSETFRSSLSIVCSQFLLRIGNEISSVLRLVASIWVGGVPGFVLE